MTIRVQSRSGLSFSSTKQLKLALLLTSVCLLSACGSAGATDAASALRSSKAKVNSGGGPTTPTPTPTTTTPTPTPTVTYDTSIGNGVDANGFADLPLRSGAHRYFVSSATGSDNNGCAGSQQPGTPLRSIAAAVSCVADSQGDQVLVAEGTTYGEVLPNMNGKRGFSPLYPTVIQSYDPSDPTNEAKFGRATANRPVINTGAGGMDLGGGGGPHPDQPAGKFVIRGFDINPGNVPGMYLAIVSPAVGTNDYILFENNLFRYTQLSIEETSNPARGTSFILRNNAFFGSWATTGHVQGAFVDNVAYVTFEDNVFWHNGWKVGANRDDLIANGGLTGDEVFRHAFYLQNDTTNNVVRRNLIVDGAADGGQYRGDSTVTENLYIDNPMAAALGGGTSYNIVRPNGVALEFAYNAILGDADITSSFPRGEGVSSQNGTSGSSTHNNLIARSRNPAGVNVWAFGTGALFNQPSYMNYDHNVVYQWTTSAGAYAQDGGPYATQIHDTYTNNVWDALTSGTNTNNATTSFPNPYTAAQLYSALGFADKQSFINYAITHPEAHIQRNARAMLFAGYGVPN